MKGYAAHERAVFEEVAAARTSLQQARTPASAAGTNRLLHQSLSRLLAVAEGYPQLRASEQFIRLQEELVDVEEKLAYARHFYNRNVLEYNTRLCSFPQVLLGRWLGFRAADFFELDSSQRVPAGVNVNQRQA